MYAVVCIPCIIWKAVLIYRILVYNWLADYFSGHCIVLLAVALFKFYKMLKPGSNSRLVSFVVNAVDLACEIWQCCVDNLTLSYDYNKQY